jgi:hypothetical protein
MRSALVFRPVVCVAVPLQTCLRVPTLHFRGRPRPTFFIAERFFMVSGALITFGAPFLVAAFFVERFIVVIVFFLGGFFCAACG